MEGIKFDSEQEYARQRADDKLGGLVALIQKWDLAKDDQQATYVLFGIVAVAVIAAIVLLFTTGGVKSKPPVPSIDGTYIHQ